jgi:hypothetical protein
VGGPGSWRRGALRRAPEDKREVALMIHNFQHLIRRGLSLGRAWLLLALGQLLRREALKILVHLSEGKLWQSVTFYARLQRGQAKGPNQTEPGMSRLSASVAPCLLHA